MTTLLLIRHGDTEAMGKVLAGWMPGWPLNQRGRQQVEELSRSLAAQRLTAIYTSPLERAVETARAIASRQGIEPQPMEGIGEMNVGEWQGKTFDELAQCPEWKAYNRLRSRTRPPGGELMVECQSRMVREVESIARQHPDGIVAVVTHGDPVRAVLAHYLGIALDFLQRFEISTASVSVLQLADWGVRVLCVNRTGEIPI